MVTRAPNFTFRESEEVKGIVLAVGFSLLAAFLIFQAISFLAAH